MSTHSDEGIKTRTPSGRANTGFLAIRSLTLAARLALSMLVGSRNVPLRRGYRVRINSNEHPQNARTGGMRP